MSVSYPSDEAARECDARIWWRVVTLLTDTLAREHQRPLDLLNRLGHLDASRAGIGAVERGAAAPDAVDLVEDVEPLGGAFVAAVEDEPVRVDDRRRAEVAALAPVDGATGRARTRTGCIWWCRRSGRGRFGSESVPAWADCRS